MKNILLLILVFTLVACSANQPALTATPTETFTPVPPTKTPVPPTRTPIPPTPTEVFNFNVCRTRAEAGNCPVSTEDEKNLAFFHAALANDKSGPFDLRKVSFDIPFRATAADFAGIGRYVELTHYVDAVDPNQVCRDNPETCRLRNIAWGTAADGYTVLKVVRLINSNGSEVAFQVRCSQDESGLEMFDGFMIEYDATLPAFSPEDRATLLARNDPENKRLLEQLIATGIADPAMNGRTFWERAYPRKN